MLGVPIVVSRGAASAVLQSGLTYRMPGRERERVLGEAFAGRMQKN